MLPLDLKISAFGPFSAEEYINFSPFYSHELMLINGPTGAGKTSILDAICFALFGETTGQISKKDGRPAKDMRSQYATDDQETSVIFNFEISGNKYEVYRSLGRKRPKKRGDGFIEEKAKAYLKRHDGNDDVFLEYAKPHVVTKLVEEIVGLEVEQFRQVAILPQGKFREFLSSDSTEKEKILTSLFDTRLYLNLTLSLKENEKELEKKLLELNLKKASLLGGASEDDVNQIEEKLKVMCSEKKEILAENKLIEKKVAELETAIQNLELSLSLKTRLKEVNEKKHLLELDKDRFENRKSVLEKNRRFRHIYELDDFCENLKKELEKDFSEIESLNAKILKLSQEKLEIETSLKAMGDFDLITEEFHSKMTLLRSEMSKTQEKETIRFDYEETSTRLSKLESKNKAYQKRESFLADRLVEYENQFKANLLQCNQIRGFIDECPNMDHVQSLWKNKKKIEGWISSKKIEVSEVVAKKNALIDQLETEKKKLIATEKLANKVAAKKLAQSISPGDECPVCGSHQHPNLQKHQKIEKSDEILEQVNELEGKIREFEIKHAGFESKISALNESLNEKKIEQILISESLSSLNIENQNSLNDLEKKISKMNQNINEMENKNSEITLLGKQARSDLTALKEEMNEFINQAELLREKKLSLKAKLEVGGSVKTTAQLTEEINTSQCFFDEIREKNNDLIDYKNLKESELARVGGLLSGLTDKTKKKENHLNIKNEELNNEILSAGYTADEIFSVRLPDEELKNIESEVGKYADELNQIIAIDTELNNQISLLGEVAEQEMLDLDGDLKIRRKDLVEFKNRLQVNFLNLGQITDQITKLSSISETLKLLIIEFSKVESEHRKVSFLSQSISGNNEKKLNLSRFALTIIFDHILETASDIFNSISKGRFSLRRSQNHSDKRKSFGLELEVFDEYTGQHRSVRTLSGGESFMASLSLALGLSEIVKIKNGGIRLDMLFIDEGFGSLDEESLTNVLETLKKLGAVASVVGLITHVSELKNEIPARIDVIPTASGSKVNVICPPTSF